MTDPQISHSAAGEKEPPSFVWMGEGEDRYWLTGRVVGAADTPGGVARSGRVMPLERQVANPARPIPVQERSE